MHRTGIPASITMAQGLLESGNGNSRLAREGNNHFGIKCKKTWTGRTIYEDDDAPGECFRAYDSAYLSYIDHSEFLMGNARYAFLFDYERTDYKNWAHGLKKAGYATNPKYPDLLITIIERHQLHELDKMKPEDLDVVPQQPQKQEPEPTPPVAEAGKVIFNEIPATRVQPGDNIIELAKRNDMGAWQVRRYNDLPKDYELTPGEIIYLKPKRRKGTAPVHVVKEGETMWSISQMYGIKLKHLYRKNHLDRKESEQPAAGQTLYLQKKNPNTPSSAGTEPKPDNPVKVVLPANPSQPGDTVVHEETPQETEPTKEKDNGNEEPEQTVKPETPKAEFSTKPALQTEEVKDTLNIPREKIDPSEKVDIHVVLPGETLFGIARKYRITVEELKELNGLNDYSIQTGQELIINGNAGPATEEKLQEPVYTHEVKKGETLYSISRLYNTTVEELKKLNNLTSNELSVGQKLKLNQGDGEEKGAVNEKPKTHTVEKGDTLYSISRKYEVSIGELKKLNGLTDDSLSVGQVLKLP